jgi:hypothetical protein
MSPLNKLCDLRPRRLTRRQIKAKNKLITSLVPERLKEAKKTEKLIRKTRNLILRNDLPVLRKAASGSSSLCSFSIPLDREELERRIDMVSGTLSSIKSLTEAP